MVEQCYNICLASFHQKPQRDERFASVFVGECVVVLACEVWCGASALEVVI